MKQQRGDILEGVNLRQAPRNELGVVYLFAELAKRWRIRVEDIQAGFPDCIAYRKIRGKEERVRIEFEYKSRSFKQHRHDHRRCDWIVCWEHNWPDAPKSLEIIELRREFGLGFNVWLLPSKPKWMKDLDMMELTDWSVPSQAHKRDLVLMYITAPEKAIRYIYRLTERASHGAAGWRPGMDYRADIEPVCKLASPVFLEDLANDRILRTSPFVRGSMQARFNVMDYWPYLYSMITRRNPSCRRKLAKYAPERLDHRASSSR